MSLAQYQQKRDFYKTAEPEGKKSNWLFINWILPHVVNRPVINSIEN